MNRCTPVKGLQAISGILRLIDDPKLRLVTGLSRRNRTQELAIAFLDIVGFSALMGADERATFDRWETLRETLVLPLVSYNGGQYIKSTGDGLLATFPTADRAARWAVEVQRGARAQGEGLRIRIGIHFGEVIVDKTGDVYGDCVNVASRLESHADPGGIIVSDALHRRLEEPSELDMTPAGELRLKNIRQAVSAHHIHTDARQFTRPTPAGPPQRQPRLPSIAVLPFFASEGEEIFAKGIVDNVISSLTGVQELSVISYSTVRAVGAARDLDPARIGETLGVDYVVAGSLTRANTQLRTDVELIEASSGEIINSDRSIFAVEDFFDAQADLTERIVALTAPEVKRATLVRAHRKPPENFTAYEYMLQALDKVSSLNRADFEQAYRYLQEAIAADPDFATPRAWLARWRTLRVGQGWSENPAHDNRQAAADAQRAIRLDRRNALALATFGHVCAYTEGDYDTAIDYLDRAAAAGPNNALVRALRSATLSFLGDGTSARIEAEKALRLSPFDEQLFQFYSFLALAHYVDGNYPEAVRWAKRSLAENPNYTNTLKVLIVSQAAAGQTDDARATAKRLSAKDPDFLPSAYLSGRAPFKDPERVERLIGHFRLAGLTG